MSNKLDQFFKGKAEELSPEFREEYKSEAATLWDRMDARNGMVDRRLLWLSLLLIIFGLGAGIAWHQSGDNQEPEKEQLQSTPRAPIAQQSEFIPHGNEGLPQSGEDAPLKGTFDAEDIRLDQEGVVQEKLAKTDRSFSLSERGASSKSQNKMARISPSETNRQSGADGTIDYSDRQHIGPVSASDGDKISIPFQNEKLNIRAANEISELPAFRQAAAQPIPLRSVRPLSTENADQLPTTSLNKMSRSPVAWVSGGAVFSGDQRGLNIGLSFGLPIGSDFCAGLGASLYRIKSSELSEYEAATDQVNGSFESSELYEVGFGPRLSLSSQIWFGWKQNRHFLSAGIGAEKVLAVYTKNDVRKQISQSNEEETVAASVIYSKTWNDRLKTNIEPYAELSYAFNFRVMPRLSIALSARKYFTSLVGAEKYELQNIVAETRSEQKVNAWSDDNYRFSLDVKYRLTQM